MNCYVCDCVDEATEAVAICRQCGVALCREHLDEGLLAQRPSGLVRAGCVHNLLGIARRRLAVGELESLL